LILRKGLKEFVYISLGFLLARGVMFLSQTYLVINSELELVASIGIGLGLLTLVQWASDMGGVFFINKYASEGPARVLEFLVARSIFCVLLFMLTYFGRQFISISILAEQILSFSPFVAVAGCFNFTGLVDHLQKNKIGGVISGIPWLFSAILVAFFYGKVRDEEFGYILGAGYTLGLIITAAIQSILVRANVYQILRSAFKISPAEVYYRFLDGLSYNISLCVTQVYGRLIPIAIDGAVGSRISGIYLYSKNIVNIASQITLFARRAEFANILKIQSVSTNVKSLFKGQIFSLSVSFVLAIFMTIPFVFGFFFEGFGRDFHDIVECLVWLSVTFIGFSVSSLFAQYLLVLGKLTHKAVIQTFTLLASYALISTYIGDISLYAVYIFEMLMYLGNIFLFYVLIRSEKKNIKKKPLAAI